MPTGRLKTWLANRGIGFIEDASGGPDISVHINALRVGGIDPNHLKRGDHLAFEISEGAMDARGCERSPGGIVHHRRDQQRQGGDFLAVGISGNDRRTLGESFIVVRD
jgi:cold shock CspA family protein